MENLNPNLPEVIIDDILSRLPVKSLLRLTSVSKLWLSSISSPQFIKFHLSKSIGNPQFSGHQLMLKNMPPNFFLMNCSVYSLLNEPITVTTDLDFPLKLEYDQVRILGSCNGLVCLVNEEVLFARSSRYGRHNLFLWNPSTRKSRRLPKCQMLPETGYRVYGFGYDEYSDDYKVVVIARFGLESKSYTVCIYSSKSESWKRIDDLSVCSLLSSVGRFVSGALHWTASCNAPSSSSTPYMIVSLDLKREKFGEVVQLNYGNGSHHLRLGILGDCFSVVYNIRSIRADVWVMKEYGVKESWTKVVFVPYRDGPLMDEFLTPLLATVNDDIMMQLKSHIWLYDSNHKTSRTLFDSHGKYLDTSIYIESLVSPNV